MENSQQTGYETQVEDVTNCINNFFYRVTSLSFKFSEWVLFKLVSSGFLHL